jgi:hypothetical protein
MPKIMPNYRQNVRRQLGRTLKRPLDEVEKGMSRPDLWRMMMIMTMMAFRAVFFYTLVLLPNTTQSSGFELLQVSASYCSHHQGVTMLYRHKSRIICQYTIHTHTSALHNSQLMKSICPCLIRASLLITLQFRLVHLILDKNVNTQSLLQHITSKNTSNVFI